MLSLDTSSIVKLAVIYNTNTTISTLREMQKDEDGAISIIAQRAYRKRVALEIYL